MSHRVKTVVINGVPTKIDTRIAFMIERIAELGLETYSSCQDNYGNGCVWIQFRNCKYAEIFATWLQSTVDWYEWQQDRVWAVEDPRERGNRAAKHAKDQCVSIRFRNKDIRKVNARLRQGMTHIEPT